MSSNSSESSMTHVAANGNKLNKLQTESQTSFFKQLVSKSVQ